MDNAEGAPEKKKMGGWTKAILWIAGIVILISIIGNAASNNNASPSSSTDTATNSTSAPSGPASSFGDGNYIVGTDIVLGTYKSSGGSDCYWERLRGFSGTTGDIIANDNTNYSTIVTIASTDKGFDSERCGTWTKISTTAATPKSTAPAKTTASASQPSSVPATTPSQTYTTPSGAIVNSSGTVVTPPPAPPASWHTVQTFSGQTQKNTSSFNIQGSQWRITWQETGDGYFGADTENPGGGNYCSIANLVGSGSDSTYCYTPGTYYISVNTANSWTMTVQDYY